MWRDLRGAAIKRIIEESKAYKEIFPTVKIAKGINSNEYWSIDWKFAGIRTAGEEEFTVCCAGLKGAVTSKRSHLCIIDDAIKSADDIKNRGHPASHGGQLEFSYRPDDVRRWAGDLSWHPLPP